MKRPGDKTPERPGGRAASRLRQFEEARRPGPTPEITDEAGKPASTRARTPGSTPARTPRKRTR